MWASNVKHVLRKIVSQVMAHCDRIRTAFKSILASTPIRESRIRLTIHFSPASLSRLRVFESSLCEVNLCLKAFPLLITHEISIL
jgi:hypothetical protein